MIIKPSQMTDDVRENMRGGAGKACITHVARGNDLPQNVRLAATITLEPGCSIGWHVHEKETEIYYIIKGSGVVNDNGVNTPVSVGDCVITPDGCGHSVENIGTGALVLFAAIILN